MKNFTEIIDVGDMEYVNSTFFFFHKNTSDDTLVSSYTFDSVTNELNKI